MKKYIHFPGIHSTLRKFIYAAICLALPTAYASTQPTIAPVVLPTTPLHSTGTVDKPTITLALSVEFPTVGSLYRQGTETTDNSFDNTKEYIGYFYTKGCYQYYTADNIDVSDQATTEAKENKRKQYRRFIYKDEVNEISDPCGDYYFKGNFLNWAASSSIDILRLALSGGDRYIDEAGLTVLQRAVIPAGNPQVACLWNHSQFFPAKQLSTSKAVGNIPLYLRNKANGKDLWISSKHDGLYFNTSKPKIRTWNDSCDISTEVNNAKAFLSSIKNGTDKNAPSIVPDGFYYVRVEVCTKSDSGTVEDFKDFDLCAEQPNGNYKPVGVIQRYANNLRVAAFGYALEHKTTRYGGVLRAPMRYIGPKHFNAYGKEIPTVNPYAEWDNYTGIIFKNPHAATDADIILKTDQTPTFENSGLLNYLNKFGRTGTAISDGSTDKEAASNNNNQTNTHYFGEYKFRDTFSGLYYQALRYLQGLDSIPDATNNLKAKAYDGFPIYANWNNIDPFGEGRTATENYACLKNNIVAIGDIFPEESGFKSVSSDPASRKSINYADWKAKALQYEKDHFSNTIKDSNNYFNFVGYAYWAHSNDIRGKDWIEENEKPDNKQRPGLRVKTFLFDVNEKGESSNYNNRSKSNQFFIAAKYGGYETFQNNLKENYYSIDEKPNKGFHPSDPDTLVTTNSIWQRRPASEIPAPGEADLYSNKNYDASTYYLQGEDGREVLKAFDDIFQDAILQAYSIAQSSSKSDYVKIGKDNYIYTATYNSDSWTGDIEARKTTIDANSKNLILTPDDQWKPAKRLNERDSNNRKIYIGLKNTQSTGITYHAQPFFWGNLPSNAKEYLDRPSISSDPDGFGEARLNYLRGSRANEKNTGNDAFRIRTSLLGDIINAGVTYSGQPLNKSPIPSYQDFYNTYANRLPLVITGANDGMLHAFAATSGNGFTASDEVFAYIPSWLISKLPLLTNKDYVDIDKHQSFVDAPSVIGDVQINFRDNENTVCGGTYKSNSTNCSSDWRTVLVSGTGAGGRGVFALDISDPINFNENNLIWEFTESDDLDIGYVVSQPKIIKLRTGEKTFRWFAAVPSGVNNYQSNFDSAGGSGKPTIFLLALDKPQSAPWKLGSNYFKISFPFNLDIAKYLAPGIIDFSMLYGTNNEVTHIYAGDLQGNLWKIDFTSGFGFKGPEKWNINDLSYFKNGKGQALPFYIAQTGENPPQRQPITSAPLLVTGPVVGGVESFYVAFGTGKYLEISDTSNTNTHRTESFYVLYDDNDPKLDKSGAASAISSRNRLKAATVNKNTKEIKFSPFNWGRAKKDEDTTQKSGWYFDLPENSERVNQTASHLGQSKISFNSKIPAQNQITQSICSEDTAYSNIYDIDITSGGGQYRVSSIGILGQSLFLENDEKMTVSNIDSTGRAKRTLVKEQINIGTKGHQVDKSTDIIEIIGRLSWRQIYNYKELKQSASTSGTTSNP